MNVKRLFISLVMVSALHLAFSTAISGAAEAPDFVTPQGTATPMLLSLPTYLYSPNEQPETLPTHQSKESVISDLISTEEEGCFSTSPNARSARFGLKTDLVKPAGIDLNVTLISRTPMHKRYEVWYSVDGKPSLRPGTENDKRWPDLGEVVTFTAQIINKGTIPSGPFSFTWLIDETQVLSGTHPSLVPGEVGREIYQWTWAHAVENERLLGQHAVQFIADPDDLIAETYESNNALKDRTDALSLVLALTPELYAALESPVDEKWSFSAEDWLQKQITAMNEALARSVYSSAPGGIDEHVRLDKILITSHAPPPDLSADGGFFMRSDDRFCDDYYYPYTDVSGSLIHELTHQLGIIDLYRLDVPLEISQVLDQNGRPVQMEYSKEYPGIMSNPGMQPLSYSEHTAIALNMNKGYRRGYYGEYLYDLPAPVRVQVLDDKGNPAPGVTVKLYQRTFPSDRSGIKQDLIDNIPEIEVETDGAGLVTLPNREVGEPITTHTGHTLVDNPLGLVDVVGRNGNFLVELKKGPHQEYLWLDITELNLMAWRGETTLELSSRIPPENAPSPPATLTDELAFGQVKLEWQPISTETLLKLS